MANAFDAYREANLQILSSIAEREKELSARERKLTDELTEIEKERARLADDRVALEAADEVHARFAARTGAVHNAPLPFNSLGDIVREKLQSQQTRARIGPQRYAMLATLRDHPHISVEIISELTGLNPARVREQMRSDQPTYVLAETIITGDPANLYLTAAGLDLLERFERYRTSQGKPLPSLTPSASEVEEED